MTNELEIEGRMKLSSDELDLGDFYRTARLCCANNNVDLALSLSSHAPMPMAVSDDDDSSVEKNSIPFPCAMKIAAHDDLATAISDGTIKSKLKSITNNGKPKSILRKMAINAHWPKLDIQPAPSSSPSVHFPSDRYIIKEIHIRPRTHILEMHALYYSDDDIRKFKRDYKRWRKRQDKANDDEGGDDGFSALDDSVRQLQEREQHHDTTFWMSTARQWHQLSLSSVVKSHWGTSRELYADDGSTASTSCNDIDNSDRSDISTSVFDLTLREAMSIMNEPEPEPEPQAATSSLTSSSAGLSNTSAEEPQHNLNKGCSTDSLHLVDTLYLY